VKYLLLICGDESAVAHAEDSCGSWTEDMEERGMLRVTGGLRPPEAAKTVRVRCAGASRVRIRCRPPSPRATPRRAPRPTPTGRRSRCFTNSSPSICPRRWWNSTMPVAVGMASGPAARLPLTEALEASGKLAGYHLLPATRADFLRRLGRMPAAASTYREALALASTDTKRRFLRRRLGGAPR
jgi:hypothetical protein